jgi:cation:H+ antiporter
MIAVAVACLPIFFSGHLDRSLGRPLFLFYYAAYTAFLLLAAQQHDALAAYGAAMTTVVLPLTAITLAVITLRQWRVRRH